MGDIKGSKVIGCEKCQSLVSSRTQIVNGVGRIDAEILFIGEGPGKEEDLSGKPFMGRSGKVLDRSLENNGIKRSEIRITNCVRCRPEGNRNPSKEELFNCKGHLYEEIRIVDPSLIVTLGKVSSEHLLGREVKVTEETGKIELIDISGTIRSLLVCIHPAATLYNPKQKIIFESTIAKVAEWIMMKKLSEVSSED